MAIAIPLCPDEKIFSNELVILELNLDDTEKFSFL